MRRCGARAGSGGGCKREEGLGWCRNLYTVGLVLGFGCGLPALRSVRVDGVYGRDEDRKQFERVRWTWSATHRQRKAYGCLSHVVSNKNRRAVAHKPILKPLWRPSIHFGHEISISRNFLLACASTFPFLQQSSPKSKNSSVAASLLPPPSPRRSRAREQQPVRMSPKKGQPSKADLAKKQKVVEDKASKLHRYFTKVPHPYRDTYSILRYIDTFLIPYQRRIKNTIQ
jgi:hypothetical protein